MSYHGRFEQQKQPKQPKDPENKTGKSGKGLKIFLIVLAVVLVLILIACAAVYFFIQNKFNKMNIVTLPEDTYVYTEATDEYTRPPETEETQVEETTEAVVETTARASTADDIINILVVGQAARAGEEYNMADTTMLISLNTYTKEVTVFSILRDSYVKLPDYKGHTCGRAKFTVCYNLGYQWGGGTAGAMEMTNICLRDNFGIEVDYNIEVSFDGFIRMIDYLNGVELELTQAEADYLNKDTLYVQRTIEPGVQVLQGMEALSYARMRKAEGDSESDIKRTERQRKLVASLLEKFRYMSLSELNGWVDELLPMVTTTMTASDVTKLAAKILPMVIDLQMTGETIPISGTGWGEMVDIYDDGNIHSVIKFETAQQKKLIRAITEAEVS
ncbi:MAG: LCP family protein [Eubacteriales bacterium]|nr:LCP family protein [Eubacteriales bacterium]